MVEVGLPNSRDKLILIAFVLSTFTVVLLPKSASTVVLFLQIPVIGYLLIKKKKLFEECWFWSLFLAAQIWIPWPLSYIFPLLVFMSWLIFLHRQEEVYAWFSIGTVDWRSIVGSVVLAVSTSGSLLLWYFLASPDISDLRRMVPTDSVLVVVVVGLLFSVFNALWEEITFKGILWNSMKDLGFSPSSIIFLQGVLFGFVHLNGFPRGWVGACLATVYGWCLGILKNRTKTLGLPVIVHFFADATIFVILVCSLQSR